MTELWDPFEPANIDDPFPAYRTLRDHHPVYHNVQRDFWALSRHADVISVAQDWQRFTNRGGVDLDGTSTAFFGGPVTPLETDPPLHSHLRKVLRGWLTPKRFNSLEPTIRSHMAKKIAELTDEEEFDICRRLCWPLPLSLMIGLLGFDADTGELAEHLIVKAFERQPGTEQISAESISAGHDLRELLATEIEKRRRGTPREDEFLTVAAQATVDGVPSTLDISIGIAFLVWSAGLETTEALLTNLFYHLGRNPGARQQAASNSALAPQVVEEVLRFDSPIQNLMRITTTSVQLHDVTIPDGARVALLFGSANRDDRVIVNPDALIFDRQRAHHLAFGAGVHSCIGAPLARLEARVVAEMVLPALGSYEIVAGNRIVKQNIRGFNSLTVRRT